MSLFENAVCGKLCCFTFYLLFVCCTRLVQADHSPNRRRALDSNPPKVSIFVLTKASFERPSKDSDHLDIYCYKGESRINPSLLWMSVTVHLVIPSDEFSLYRGSNESDVYEQFLVKQSSWFANFVPWRSESVSLSPFNKTCIGVSTTKAYTLRFNRKVVEPRFLGYLVAGIILFFSAQIICRNIVFYYGAGVSVGLFASLLILVFIISRFVPKRSGAYVVLGLGWSVSAWVIHYLWENVQTILERYYIYVAVYFIVAVVISWAVCYYKGPPSNPRLHNLIQWALQGVALALVYNSTQIPQASLLIIAALLAWYNLRLPAFVPRSISKMWYRMFPLKVKLLTLEEYEAQGNEETQRALKELREFCRSPDCDTWKTVSRLHSPTRFARFVEGDCHLSEDEVESYENEPVTPLTYLTDDEDEPDHRMNTYHRPNGHPRLNSNYGLNSYRT